MLFSQVVVSSPAVVWVDEQCSLMCTRSASIGIMRVITHHKVCRKSILCYQNQEYQQRGWQEQYVYSG